MSPLFFHLPLPPKVSRKNQPHQSPPSASKPGRTQSSSKSQTPSSPGQHTSPPRRRNRKSTPTGELTNDSNFQSPTSLTPSNPAPAQPAALTPAISSLYPALAAAGYAEKFAAGVGSILPAIYDYNLPDRGLSSAPAAGLASPARFLPPAAASNVDIIQIMII